MGRFGPWVAHTAVDSRGQMTHEDDMAMIAGRLADLTRVVKDLADQLSTVREAADTQQGGALTSSNTALR